MFGGKTMTAIVVNNRETELITCMVAELIGSEMTKLPSREPHVVLREWERRATEDLSLLRAFRFEATLLRKLLRLGGKRALVLRVN